MKSAIYFLKYLEKNAISVYNKPILLVSKEGERNMATREKNVWILILFVLCGIVIGGLLGELASKVDFLWWLGYGESFGLTSPVELNLSVIKITFGLVFKINIASIIGMAIAIFVYRKV